MITFSKEKRLTKGFTLIELLVVIAIIGVLASIVLASLNNARKKSRDARRITDIKQIQLALELYFDGQSNKYPQANTTCNATTNAYGLEALATNNYIPQVPRDPLSTSVCYKYATKTAEGASPITYHLGATLEDPANQALNGDKDLDSSASYTNGFNGADPVYDVTP